MEGFTEFRLKPWVRRLATRLLSIVPAALVAGLAGDKAVNTLLVLSQVFLSLTLPVVVIPICHFTGSAKHMGAFRNSRTLSIISWVVIAIILALNVFLLVQVPLSYTSG